MSGHLPELRCDALVVGGGINGAGIARDLAGRGLSVVLAERDDLAGHTSSSSTKLIHGGLRYLEHREFLLVRKALAERERLLRSAPHIMWPMRFVMPHDPGMRPAWLIRLGLFLYDHLARRELLPGSRSVDLRRHVAGEVLKPGWHRGFVYSDGWVDDARLVVLNAVDAAERGAQILTRTACLDARRADGRWHATLRHGDGRQQTVSAAALVNAAGPWAAQFLGEQVRGGHPRALRLIRGSHIVVPRLFAHDHAYLFQNPDRRIIFAIPYEHDFTLIGTTDVEHHGSPAQPRADAAELAYLCEQASRYFARSVTPADVVWSYSGVRPLLDDASGDPSAITRDYALELDAAGAPLLSVWGGKITTFRKLAEEAADQVCAALGRPAPAWTAEAVLPGGDLAGDRRPQRGDVVAAFEAFVAELVAQHPDRSPLLLRRLARAHGSRVHRLLALPPGAEVAPGLHESELHWLHREEWARCADDVLWRRTKLGLHFTAAQRGAVDAWCETHWAQSLHGGERGDGFPG